MCIMSAYAARKGFTTEELNTLLTYTDKQLSELANKINIGFCGGIQERAFGVQSLDRKPVQSRTFWRRHLKRERTRAIEQQQLTEHRIGASRRHYVSEQTGKIMRERDALSERYLSALVLRSVHGNEITGADLLINREYKRFSETYTCIKGMEKLAARRQYAWAMITLTLPPEYHPLPMSGNSCWAGISPAEGQASLVRRNSLVRALISKSGLRSGTDFFGYRFVEPHKDGCPHWHILLFASKESLTIIEGAFRAHFPTDLLCKFTLGELGKGSAKAASYCAKYIMKSVNVGHDSARETDSADLGSISVNDWRRAHGIRASQVVGKAYKGIYRFLRSEGRGFDVTVDTELHNAYFSAKSADWVSFWKTLQNGSVILKRDQEGGKVVGLEMSNICLIKTKWTQADLTAAVVTVLDSCPRERSTIADLSHIQTKDANLKSERCQV